jgi:hypothetical protein
MSRVLLILKGIGRSTCTSLPEVEVPMSKFSEKESGKKKFLLYVYVKYVFSKSKNLLTSLHFGD